MLYSAALRSFNPAALPVHQSGSNPAIPAVKPTIPDQDMSQPPPAMTSSSTVVGGGSPPVESVMTTVINKATEEDLQWTRAAFSNVDGKIQDFDSKVASLGGAFEALKVSCLLI